MRVVLRVAIAVAILVTGWLLYLYYEAGQFRSLEPLAAGTCRAVENVVGAEDIVVDRGAAMALVSSDPRDGSPGALYAYALDLRGEDRVTKLEPAGGPEALHPHGISLFSRESGGGTLFVVHHGSGGDSIEIFSWEPSESGGELRHRDSVRDPLLVSANDVAAVDDRRFYATNDHASSSRGRQVLGDLLRRAGGSVVYWDGSRTREVARDIPYANGIGVSRDGTELYVAATTSGEVLVYDRDPVSGDLDLRKAIATGTGVDNVTVDQHGELWIAAHPHLVSFLRHSRDHARRSPSEIVWVDPDELAEPFVRRVWLDPGDALSGSSVAVPYGARILVGSVFEEHFLVCDRSARPSS